MRARVSEAWKEWRVMASIRPVMLMLYGSQTWAMTKKDEDILRKCDRRMLRYMARVKWQDWVSSEEVARKC